MKYKQKMYLGDMTIDMSDEYNRPIGEIGRKYDRYWNLFIKDVNECNNGFEIPECKNADEEDYHYREREKNLRSQGLREQFIITKETLQDYFSGKIRDWDYLLKFAQTMSEAQFEYDVEEPFSYKLIDENTIQLNLGLIPSNIEN